MRSPRGFAVAAARDARRADRELRRLESEAWFMAEQQRRAQNPLRQMIGEFVTGFQEGVAQAQKREALRKQQRTRTLEHYEQTIFDIIHVIKRTPSEEIKDEHRLDLAANMDLWLETYRGIPQPPVQEEKPEEEKRR